MSLYELAYTGEAEERRKKEEQLLILFERRFLDFYKVIKILQTISAYVTFTKEFTKNQENAQK